MQSVWNFHLLHVILQSTFWSYTAFNQVVSSHSLAQNLTFIFNDPVLVDASETYNLYGDSASEIQAIQADLEAEIEAEKLVAVPPMNPYDCSNPNNLLDGFWSAGPGEGWCGCSP